MAHISRKRSFVAHGTLGAVWRALDGRQHKCCYMAWLNGTVCSVK